MLIITKMKALRQIRGLSITQLSERSGYSRSLLSQVENERLAPTEAVQAAICKALGSNPTELFEEEQK